MSNNHPIIDIGLHAPESKGLGCLGIILALGVIGGAITHIASTTLETSDKQVAAQSQVVKETLPEHEKQIKITEDKAQTEEAQPDKWSSGIEQVKKQAERLEPYTQQIQEQGAQLKTQAEKLEPHMLQLKTQAGKLQEHGAQLRAQTEKLEPHMLQLKTQAGKLQEQAGNVGNTIKEKALSINRQETIRQAPLEQLTLQSSCNFSASETATRHKVIGDSEALILVKEHYCQDAFINTNGNLQIASFNSQSEAEEFSNSLNELTGYNFRVLTSQ